MSSRAQVYADILRRVLRSPTARARAVRVLGRLHSADVADVLTRLPPGEQGSLVDLLLDSERMGQVLAELPPERADAVLPLIDDAQLAALLARLPPDDAIGLVNLLPDERRARVVAAFAPPQRADLEQLQRFAPGTAGSLMNTRIFTLPRKATAQEAIDLLRERGEDEAESIFYLYVVDEEGRLDGVVPVRRLLTARPNRPLSEIAILEPVAVTATAASEEAARIVARYNLLAVPVVDEDRRLLGMITVDDVIDIMQEQATHSLYGLAGLSEDDRVFSPPWQSFKKRLPWMVINLGTAFLASWVVGLFEQSIAKVVALATFMPIVAGMGGNGGTQALTVVTRGIALGELEASSGLRAVVKEVAVSVAIGATTGALTALAAWLWTGQAMLGVVLFLAMIINLAIAGFAGAAIPLVLRALKRDPALGGGVIVTTFTDVFGYGAFLGIATLLLKYLA